MNLKNVFLNQMNAQAIKKRMEVENASLPTYSAIKEPTASTVNYGGPMSTHPMKNYLEKQNIQLQNNLDRLNDQYNKDKAALDALERRQKIGNVANTSAKTLAHNLGTVLNPYEMPGNVGDINRIVWPFWFNSSDLVLGPNQAGEANISITQEAGFILLYYSKIVYSEISGSPGTFAYVDPDAAGSGGKANNLSFTFRDASSSRSFMNRPMDINQVGYWRSPTRLPQPLFFLPNSNLNITFQNNDATATYKPIISFFGYRFRLDHAKDILSLVYG